eukprot:GFUD01026659.1.p1 GENE.GFUD01026659.1~~GFUD01026659.1.p1  ORF type:complete len:1744 (+),score=379.20 GFUD01026659.1:118-5349(+)
MSELNFYPVFVNHIAESVKPADLRALFSRFGNVIDVVIVCEFGFVNMSDENGAREAIKNLNGRGLHSNLLHVDYSEELKYYMTNKRTRYMCTPDPLTQMSGTEHPAYPTGPQIDSPFPNKEGGGDFTTLVTDREILDERLRKVNEELEAMKQKEIVGGRVVGGPRSRERRSRSCDRGRDMRRPLRRSRSRSRERGGDHRRQFAGPGRRMSPGPDRRRWSPERPHQRDRDWDHRPGPSRGYRGGFGVDRDRPGPSGERSYREGDRSYGAERQNWQHEREHPPDDRRQFSPGRRDFRDRDHQRHRSPLRGRLGSPVHRRSHPLGTVTVTNEQRQVGQMDPSWRPVEGKPEEDLRPSLSNAGDLRSTLDKRSARASDEFEDGVNIDLSKKNMKIQINIGTKDLDNADRQIMLEGEAQNATEDEFDFFIGGLHKKVFGADLRSIFERYGRVTKAEPVKSYAFVNLVTTEERAITAVNELSETFHFGNKLFVEFRKGSKYEYLKSKVSVNAGDESSSFADRRPVPVQKHRNSYPASSEDGIVIVGDGKKGVKSEVTDGPNLPMPVPVATTSKLDENLIENFVKSTRHDTDSQGARWSNWGESKREIQEDQYFDGYGVAAQNSDIKNEDQLPRFDGYYSTPGNAPAKEPTSADLKLIMQAIQTANSGPSEAAMPTNLSVPPPGYQSRTSFGMPVKEPINEGPKAQRKLHISGLSSRVDDYDLKDLFSKYGQINRVDSKITYAFILIFTSELSAVQCVCELDGHHIKGSKMKVAFMRGSYEETKEFKEKWANEIRTFTSEKHKSEVDNISKPPPKMALSEIGEGLKNIDMSLSLEPVHPSYQQHADLALNQSNLNNFGQSYSNYPGQLPAGTSHHALSNTGYNLNLPPPIQAGGAMISSHIPGVNQRQGAVDANYLSDVEGTIHSIQNKMVLLEFSHPYSRIKSIAKLIPGQMYINGQQSLGFVIKSNTFHTWPKMVKDFLQIGRQVCMDLKRLSEKEMHEQKDRERSILWSSPLIWLQGHKPSEKDITISEASMDTRISTAIVVKLFPTWGLLKHGDGEIVFKVDQVFWETAPLKETDSLVTNSELEVGDLVAVHYCEVSINKMQEIIYKIPGGVNLSSVRLSALLVWQVSAEVDPWVYHPRPTEQTFNFLTTSSTLNRQLPGDREAEFHNLTGEVEEIHLPAGGIIKLNPESVAQLRLPPTSSLTLHRVYFHRSRLHINGSKIQSDQRLDQELVPGDKVSLDLVRNYTQPNDPPFVMSGAHWVALAVRAHTVVRGVQIASKLKQECTGHELLPANTFLGRVVYLNHPPDPRGPVTSGVAIVDSGDFLGQRVEFDRNVCAAFGFPLHKADLSHLFSQGETVHIKLKPYNSYCVEKLWLGFTKGNNKEGSLDQTQRAAMKQVLDGKAVTGPGFDQLVKGQYQPRIFLPLARQEVAGQIVSLQEDQSGVAASLTIRSSCGAVVTADRSSLYVFGQWMGRADLAYCMRNEHVLYSLSPRYSTSPSDTACLVWVGGPEARPRYSGQATVPHITEAMNCHLKLWLASKNLDLSIFKALIDGLLPSKKATLATGTPGGAGKVGAGLDAETLAQAALLQKMKSQYGPQKMMSALMSMINSDPPGPPNSSIPGLSEPPHTSSTTMSTTASSRGYYSSGALTASYSASPQPPDNHPPPPDQYHTQEQYAYPHTTYPQAMQAPTTLASYPGYPVPPSPYPQPYQPPVPTPPYYQHSGVGVSDPHRQTNINPLNPIFQNK